MFLPKPSDNDFSPPPPGTHMATCYRVIDLGTQQVEYQGQQKLQHKIMLSWELPHELMDDGRPFTISQRYTFSMSEKATLRQHLEAWRGRQFTLEDLSGPPNGFHMQKVIGAGCMLNIMHEEKNGKTYPNIKAIMALPKGTKAAPLINAPLFFSIGEFDESVFEQLSDGLKQIIQKSPEYQEIVHKRHVPDANGVDGYGAGPRDDLDNLLSEEIPF